MTKRTAQALVVALALLVGATLGAASTATAAGLTKGAVRKIAAKVVTTKASSLSVAHAAAADSATNAGQAGDAAKLDGRAPSAYQNTVTRYALTSSTSSVQKAFPLTGLAPGTYEVQWALLMDSFPVNNASSACWVDVNGTASFSSYGTNLANALDNSGHAVVDIPAGATATVACLTSDPVTTFPSSSYAWATSVDQVVERAASSS